MTTPSAATDASVGPAAVPSAATSALSGDLRSALGRLHRRLRAERGDAQLSDPMFSVLVLLDRDGPATPGQLAEAEGVQPPTMTRTVGCLAELGLVHKGENPTDGRQVVVSLTPVGADEVALTRRRRNAWLTAQLDRLTEEERELLARAAQVLGRVAAG